MIEGTAINLMCARCIHCEMCSWIKDVNDGCDWFEEDKEYSFRIEIPDNATNGDVIKAMFQNAKIFENENNVEYPYVDVFLYSENDMNCYKKDWWNSPYQKGGKTEC